MGSEEERLSGGVRERERGRGEGGEREGRGRRERERKREGGRSAIPACSRSSCMRFALMALRSSARLLMSSSCFALCSPCILSRNSALSSSTPSNTSL